MIRLIRDWILPVGVFDLLYYWCWAWFCRRYFSTLARYQKKSSRLFVLANGPSLKVDVCKFMSEILKNDSLAVNQFCQSEYFEVVKPRVYVLSDPKYFVAVRDVEDAWQPRVLGVRKDLVQKVTWEMFLVVPDVARNSELVKLVKSNNKIKVLFYCSRPSSVSQTNFLLLCKNLIKPPASTVVNVATYLGVFWKYQETILLGADTSGHTMMIVDQVSNEMFLDEKHFYGRVKRPFYMDNKGTIRATAADWLSFSASALRGYEVIARMARYNKVSLVNASSFSWIDSISRMKIGGGDAV